MLIPKNDKNIRDMTYVAAVFFLDGGKLKPIYASRIDERDIIKARDRALKLCHKYYWPGNKFGRFLAIVEIEHPNFTMHSEAYRNAMAAAQKATEDMLIDKAKWNKEWRLRFSPNEQPDFDMKLKPVPIQVAQVATV